MSVLKYWLLGGWYTRGLIVQQQRYRSSDRSTDYWAMIHSGTNSPAARGIDPVIEVLTTGRMIHSGTNMYFYIWLLLMPVSGSVLLLCAGAHKISLKYLFPEKMFIEVCCQKCQKCNTICVTTFFYWISRVCKKKKN